ncbi:MAG TPA: O-antigen ligase family protein [Leptolyngbyaceae cyanobacterium]
MTPLSPLPLSKSAWPSPLGWGLGGLVVAVIVLFTVLPLSYYRMVAWPWIGLWQVGFLTAGLLLIGLLRRFDHPFQRLGHGLDEWVLAVGVALVLSGLLSPFRAVALWNSVLVLGYGLLLYLGRQVLSYFPQVRQWAWRGLVGVAAGTAAISLSLWRPDPAMWAANNFWVALRNHQPLGHHNFVGGFFALVLPWVGAWSLAQKGWLRWLGLGLTLLVATALYVSGSRGAALGCLAWAVITLIWATVTTRGAARWRRLALGSGLLLILVLLLSTNPRIRDWVSGVRLAQTGGAPVAIADGPTLDRAFMLQLGANILKHRPLVGVGPGNMTRVSNLYRPIETGEGLDHIQQLHNTPMQLAGELGVMGIGLYLAFWGLLGRLWWRLYRRLPMTATCDRMLLYGLGGSWLAYGIASLTDYQLENIPIASTLGLSVLLLLSLAREIGDEPTVLPQRQRRIASLGVLSLLGLMIYLWVPFDLALALGQGGEKALEQSQLVQAEDRWYKASTLTPWDPTFSALASEKLLGIGAILEDSSGKLDLDKAILDYSLRAEQAAPYDVWFNQNLAVLYQDKDLAAAERYASRAAQLLPRNQNLTYCLLGQIYVSQSKLQKAVAAFTLEALVRPAFLTYTLWAEAPYQDLYGLVQQSTLKEYERLLNALSPQAPEYESVYEKWALLHWWTEQPLDQVDLSRLRPLVRSLLQAEQTPAVALATVETALANGETDPGLPLLAAWLNPERYLASYLTGQSPEPGEARLIEQMIQQYRSLRPWLTSLAEATLSRYRGALAFAYRNQSANSIQLMLQPNGLNAYTFIQDLGLFSSWSREFPALDRQIEQLRTDALGLPHPTRRNFQLVAPLS